VKNREQIQMSQDVEMILAEEEDVVLKDNVPGTMKNLVGTLLLTDRRLFFVEADKEDKENLPVGRGLFKITFRYADVHDLGEVSANPNNLSIPLNAIENVSGSQGIIHPPELKVSWKANSGQLERAVFTEELINDRKKDLKDWAKVITGLKDGTLKPRKPSSPPPSPDSLEAKIMHVMSDMQEKGVLEVEEETEKEFKLDLDPDQVETICEQLAQMGFLNKYPDKTGDSFYRMKSPLDEDDLSS
jgi:hypothetical protein